MNSKSELKTMKRHVICVIMSINLNRKGTLSDSACSVMFELIEEQKDSFEFNISTRSILKADESLDGCRRVTDEFRRL